MASLKQSHHLINAQVAQILSTVLRLNKDNSVQEMRHIEMSKAAPKKSICHFQKLEMILKRNKQ